MHEGLYKPGDRVVPIKPVTVSHELRALEKTVEKGLAGLVEAGSALKEISQRRLYREHGYKNFDAYLRARWGIERTYAHRLIKAAEVSKTLSTGNISPPETERQVRELAKAGDAAAKVWQEVVAEHGTKPPASAIRQKILEVKQDTPISKKPPILTDINRPKEHYSSPLRWRFDGAVSSAREQEMSVDEAVEFLRWVWKVNF